MILCKPLTRRDSNGPLRVIIPARISTPTQDEASIESQFEDAEKWLRRVYSGEIEVRTLGEQMSGWVVDRPTMIQARELIETGRWDAVVVTELREVYRNPAEHWRFVQFCLDNNVRFISVANDIDTAADTWENMMYLASLQAGMTVPETRRRVRRKATYSFGQGGMVLKVKFGYRKLTLEESKSGEFGTPGLRIAKLADQTPIIQEMRRRVLEGQSPEAVGDWLNDQAIPPGPYVTSKRWTGKLVIALLRDPILSGQRRFRSVIYQQIYRTGKHRRVKNKDGVETKNWPALAHLTAEEQAELIVALDARRIGGKLASGTNHPRYSLPRTRSFWPGQHARCGACGGLMYRYGHFLKCQNAVPNGPRTCWNHVQVRYDALRSKALAWIISLLDRHPNWHSMIVDAAWAEFERHRLRRLNGAGVIDDRISQLRKDAGNLTKAIKLGRQLPTLVAELRTVQESLDKAESEKEALEKQARQGGFATRADVAAKLPEALPRMAECSFEFADLLRRLIPEFVIVPVQALDCTQVRPRGRLTLRLDPWRKETEESFEASIELDLFEPPVHIRFQSQCAELKASRPDLTLKQVADRLEIGHMTVKRALDYAQRMKAAGVSQPYVPLSEAPERASRWRVRQRKSA